MSAGVATAAAFEKEPSLVQEHELGKLHETADGRRYRYAQILNNPGTAIEAGFLAQCRVSFSEYLFGSALSGAPFPQRGATKLTIAHGGGQPNPIPANTFAGGTAVIIAGPAGLVGTTYRINGHTYIPNAADVAQYPTVTFTLDGDDPLTRDADASVRLSFSPSRYAGVGLAQPAPYAAISGVTICQIPANTAVYAWIQTRGLAVIRCTGAANGLVAPLYPGVNGVVTLTNASGYYPIGYSAMQGGANAPTLANITLE